MQCIIESNQQEDVTRHEHEESGAAAVRGVCCVIVAGWLTAGLTYQSGQRFSTWTSTVFPFLPFFVCFGFGFEALIANGSYITEYRVHQDLPCPCF